jgi:putative ABC transport system ATP-binding protein
MATVIELSAVTKTYAGVDIPALESVDLTLDAGLITAIMGPSGCGKSTMLNLIGGLDRPTHGEVVVDGVRVDRMSETESARFRRRKVGYIFQFFQLLDELSVRDNIAVAAQLAGMSRNESRRQALELLEQLGLADRAERYPASLSGGERQRVAIARAVINSPSVILADEPTGALDSHNGEQVLALLEDLNRLGQTILFVTHDEHLAATRAHRVVRLSDGRIVGDQRLTPTIRIADEGQAA